jgi:methylaspartate mutase epsilon subunit
MELKHKRWTDEEFLKERKEVLARWPTGKEVDLDEAIEYHKRLPENKIWPKRIVKAKREGRMLLHITVGKATAEETIKDLQYIDRECPPDAYQIISDAYTRKLMLEEAQKGIERSIKEGRSMINGFPWINHGVKVSRRVTECHNQCSCINGNNDEIPMLMAEIGLASGCTLNLLNDLRDSVTHEKDYPLDKRIMHNQYVCKLAAYYTERGAPISLHAFGSVIPWCHPGEGIAITVLECLTAAEQGVKFIAPTMDTQGNMIQDIAHCRVMREMTGNYLHQFGYHDVDLSPDSYLWSGQWPRDEEAGCGWIAWTVLASVWGGLDWINGLRSPMESVGIPTPQSNVLAIKIARQIIAWAGKQKFPECEELREEEEMLRLQVKAIIDRVLELGNGDPAVGEVRAVEAGIIDPPYSCWKNTKGKTLTIRDANKAIRYFEWGNVPLPKEVIEFNRRKLVEREKKEGRKIDFDLLIEDLRTIGMEVAGKYR